jgi:Fe-S-cluster containining protein
MIQKRIIDLSNNKSTPAITECNRCGTCCKKGGPSFHLEDKMLIEKGIILSKHLYTIRIGELSHDNIKECLLPAASDIIKIKGQKDSWTCIFFDEKENECIIYDNRPLECRVLKCWDTREIEKIYSKNRLTRKDLISTIGGLWDLIEDHQTQCSYDKLKHFIEALNGSKKDDTLKGILDIIEYDTRIRKLVVQKGGLEPDMTDFLFGRPLTETIRMYGFKVTKTDNHYRLVPF